MFYWGDSCITYVQMNWFISCQNISLPTHSSGFSGLRCISKPGLRVYAQAEEVPYVLNGLGIAILSTSKGVMTDKEARKNGVGGEVLAYIW